MRAFVTFAAAAALAVVLSTPAAFSQTTEPAPQPEQPEAGEPPAAEDGAAAEEAGEVRDEEPNRQDDVDGVEVDPALPGFLEGSKLTLKPRTYYLNRDRDKNQDNLGWALGGSVDYLSGWWLGRVQVGAVVYTSQELYGPEEKDGTLLFKPGPEGFTVLGEAFVTARLGEREGFRIGRQSFDLPYLARHDIRMAPNTFEAVGFGRRAKSGFAYVAAYVDTIKRKNDDEFIPLSEAAGAPGSDEGLGLLGAQYTFADGSVVGATNQTTFEVMNTFFAKAERSLALDEGRSLRGYVQYTDQRSIGDELIGGFETYLVAVKAELFLPHSSFRLAVSTTGDEKGIQSPYGGPPNYVAIIVDNFDRAGEDAWLVGASYDFAGVGYDGLSFFTNIATGRTPDSGPTASPDETEYDLTVDYRFQKENPLNPLWLRVRAAYLDQDEGDTNGDDFFDFRVIVNYSFELLD